MNKEWLLFLRSVPFFAKVRPFPSFFHFSFCFLLIVVLWVSFVPKAFDTIHKEEKKRKKERKKNLFSLWLFLWNGNIEREGAPADRWIRVQEKQIGLSWIWPLRFKTSVKEKKLLETSFVISFLTKQKKTQITTKHPKWKSLVCSSLISAKPPIVSTMNRKSHLKTPKEERHSGGNQRKHRDQVPTISLKLEHCNTLEHTGHHIFQG